jgi:DNA end-binding protein Ku
VIREAIKKKGMVALGHVVFTTREHVIAIEPRGKGMLGITLRYPYEIRNEADYFSETRDEKVPQDMLDLAIHIVDIKSGHFERDKFTDHYENALIELIRKRQRGGRIEKPKERPLGQVINLKDALRRSVEAERSGARSHRQRAATTPQRIRANQSNARVLKAS